MVNEARYYKRPSPILTRNIQLGSKLEPACQEVDTVNAGWPASHFIMCWLLTSQQHAVPGDIWVRLTGKQDDQLPLPYGRVVNYTLLYSETVFRGVCQMGAEHLPTANLAAFCALLANPIRLDIMRRLANANGSELSFNALLLDLRISKRSLKSHLDKLVEDELIVVDKFDGMAFYRTNGEVIAAFLSALRAHLVQEESGSNDIRGQRRPTYRSLKERLQTIGLIDRLGG